MIKFKAEELFHSEYVLSLIGNDGEEQLIIVRSWGQDCSTSLVIVAATVDDNVRILYNTLAGVRLEPDAYMHQVENAVRVWCGRGIQPTDDEKREQEVEIQSLLLAIKELDYIREASERLARMKELRTTH